jgi:hypothetical protein
LAAFVVVAIVAAILLVTSVRSQAAPGWLRVPATAVAEVPSALSDVWQDEAPQDAQVLEPGATLAHRPARVQGTAGDPAEPASDAADVASTSQRPHQAQPASAPRRAGPQAGPLERRPHERTSVRAADAADLAGDVVAGSHPGHGHAFGHTAHGHGHGHGHGHAHRHAPHGHGHGAHRGWSV